MSPTLQRIRDRWEAARRSRVLPLVLVAGVVAAASTLVPHVPHERAVALRLDDAASVTAVDVEWTPADGDGEAAQGGAWHFPPGKAPIEIVAQVRLPDGRYRLDATVERGDARTTVHRAVTLGDADRITVPLR